MNDYRPPGAFRRETVQFIPDRFGKTGLFRSELGLEGYDSLPLVGWALVVTFEADELPRLTVEPVVDDRCMGPVPLGDLEEEVGPLTLLEIV
ncbi:hypothetical protein [Streptomyces sp. NBC_01451]|uniref:hypothetical protein n=1 Tax=Streptomyces sp. NBC_01451 TaxID=2903872 RepID=UPI002E32E431|nr:hypothetical protein [Streptomyces sp. NBC_01451]